MTYKSNSSGESRPPSPLQALTPSADMADTTTSGQVSQSPTPQNADSSMAAKQFYCKLTSRPLTRNKFKQRKATLKRKLSVLAQVAKRAENQLSVNELKEPQPGTSKDSNSANTCDSIDKEQPVLKKRTCHQAQ